MTRLYMDVNVPAAITDGVRLRGIDVLTAQEDGWRTAKDPALLDRATLLGRALFTMDDDFLAEGALRQRTGVYFAGVIYVHPLETNVGRLVRDLELICVAGGANYMDNRVEWLPF